MTVRVLLADDHTIVRYSLRRVLEVREGVEVVAEASNGREAVALVGEHEPDVVLMDVAMPEMNGVEATKRILAARPETRVLALSGHAHERLVAEMLSAGARGYVLKDAGPDELVQAIERVADGGAYLCRAVADVVLTDYVQRLMKSPSSTLSDREREVLQLLAEGKATKEIASVLGISVKTVESHRARVMDKLGLHSVAELTKYAIRIGLTSVDG